MFYGLTSSDVVMVHKFGVVFNRSYMDKNCTSVTGPPTRNENTVMVLVEENSELLLFVHESSMLDCDRFYFCCWITLFALGV